MSNPIGGDSLSRNIPPSLQAQEAERLSSSLDSPQDAGRLLKESHSGEQKRPVNPWKKFKTPLMGLLALIVLFLMSLASAAVSLIMGSMALGAGVFTGVILSNPKALEQFKHIFPMVAGGALIPVGACTALVVTSPLAGVMVCGAAISTLFAGTAYASMGIAQMLEDNSLYLKQEARRKLKELQKELEKKARETEEQKSDTGKNRIASTQESINDVARHTFRSASQAAISTGLGFLK